MQRLHDLTPQEFKQRLTTGRLPLHVGPYVYNMQSNLSVVRTGITTLYSDFVLAHPDEFVDFDIGLNSAGITRRLRREAQFLFDKKSPFDAIPIDQAYAFLEWGMNWCVSMHANEYLKLHAAAVSKDGHAIIMPGIPGAGKSTLCAALGLSGWRILSDEHAMIPPGTNDVVPLCRPVSLKNESIDVIRSFSPDAVFGPVSEETHKGVVAHMKADIQSGSHEQKNITAKLMIFPQFARDEAQQLTARRRTESFILAAYHSFNYSLLSETGFESMKTLIENVECFDLVYHDLNWAVDAVNQLSDSLDT